MMEDLENMKTLSDWFEYLDEPFACSDALALFEDLNDLISNQSDIGARIEGKGSGGKRQQAEAYYELVIGKDLQRLAKERNYDLKYELEYGDPCSKKSASLIGQLLMTKKDLSLNWLRNIRVIMILC